MAVSYFFYMAIKIPIRFLFEGIMAAVEKLRKPDKEGLPGTLDYLPDILAGAAVIAVLILII